LGTNLISQLLRQEIQSVVLALRESQNGSACRHESKMFSYARGKLSRSLNLFVYSRKELALVLANLLADRTKIAFSKSSYFNNFSTSKFLREKNL